MSELASYRGTGKRKTSVARVILRPGDGTTWINGRTLEEYFPRATHRTTVMAPLKLAGAEGRYDLRVRVAGGGPTGQAGAVRHGIARALVESHPVEARGLPHARRPQGRAQEGRPPQGPQGASVF
jgi:small subunit ribosomal protein S9